MNYAQARERKKSDGTPSGLWDWTVKWDDGVYQAAPCSDSCGHFTKEAAERHFYDYSLEQVMEHTDPENYKRCAVCGEITNVALGNIQLELYSFWQYLCLEHCTKEQLSLLQPFHGDLAMVYS